MKMMRRETGGLPPWLQRGDHAPREKVDGHLQGRGGYGIIFMLNEECVRRLG